MNKEKWQSMTDEQKTSYMRKVFKEMNIGDSFDYAECRRVHDRMTAVDAGTTHTIARRTDLRRIARRLG